MGSDAAAFCESSGAQIDYQCQRRFMGIAIKQLGRQVNSFIPAEDMYFIVYTVNVTITCIPVQFKIKTALQCLKFVGWVKSFILYHSNLSLVSFVQNWSPHHSLYISVSFSV